MLEKFLQDCLHLKLLEIFNDLFFPSVCHRNVLEYLRAFLLGVLGHGSSLWHDGLFEMPQDLRASYRTF